MVGIMRAGAAYVPLDPKLPVQRLKYVVEQCECVAVAALQECTEVAAQLGVEMVELVGTMQTAGGTNGASKVIGDCGPLAGLAYVLFTSGSTGKPKGVMVQQSSLCAYLGQRLMADGMRRHAGPGDMCLYVLGFTFDVSVACVWQPLTSGATVVVTKPGAWLDPAYLLDLMSAAKVTSMWAVPSPFANVLQTGKALPRCLRELHMIGEALLPHMARQITGAGIELYNQYGPAECTIASHVYRCCQQNSQVSSMPIGAALSNTTGYVLDSAAWPVPVGVPGELYIGGPKVCRGYIGRADLTEKAFVHCPTLPTAGRLYKTGDRVRCVDRCPLPLQSCCSDT